VRNADCAGVRPSGAVLAGPRRRPRLVAAPRPGAPLHPPLHVAAPSCDGKVTAGRRGGGPCPAVASALEPQYQIVIDVSGAAIGLRRCYATRSTRLRQTLQPGRTAPGAGSIGVAKYSVLPRSQRRRNSRPILVAGRGAEVMEGFSVLRHAGDAGATAPLHLSVRTPAVLARRSPAWSN
jgi:hypothetical protein